MRRPDRHELRAAVWALQALRHVRRDLARCGIGRATVPTPPELPPGAVGAVSAALRRLGPTCLERSLVLQKWYEAHGIERDVVVGVTGPGAGFAAHAWLDGDAVDGEPYHELRRLRPR